MSYELAAHATTHNAAEELLKAPLEAVETYDNQEEHHGLVIFNDSHNTFDHVINILIKACKHDRMQAEQCAYIIHFKGKCCVKKGGYGLLKPMHEYIVQEGINAEII